MQGETGGILGRYLPGRKSRYSNLSGVLGFPLGCCPTGLNVPDSSGDIISRQDSSPSRGFNSMSERRKRFE